MQIIDLPAFGIKNKAPDLHLDSEMFPVTHVHGDIRCINLPEITTGGVGNMVIPVMNDHQRRIFQQDLEVDSSFELSNVARLRVGASTSNRGPVAIFRTIPSTVLTLRDSRVPRVFQKIVDNPRGLALATDPTGSGKSATLAAMINYINETQPVHILTIEDPIEFVHLSKKALISQRELHQRTHSFANALCSALREDPDAALAGEMRDPETVGLALTVVETGHSVFDILHTTGTAKIVDRIIDVFSAGEKEVVRSMLSESLRAVISQTLLKTHDGNGRVAAYEIPIPTSAVRNLIRENRIAQINSTLQTGQAHGIQMLGQALQALVRQSTISPEVVRNKAQNSESPLTA